VLIDRAAYWDHPAVSQSDLKLFDDSPYHFWAAKIAKITPPRDTTTLRRGRALHARLFEPEGFDERFPRFDLDLRTKVGKEAYAAIDHARVEALDGCVIRDMDDVDGMVAGIRANAAAVKLLERVTHAEFPIVWTCVETGVECRARLDAIANLGTNVVVDVKSISDVPKQANLEKAIANYGYNRQAAQYMAAAEAFLGKRPSEYILVFVESKPPYACAVHTLDSESLAIGNQWRLSALTDLAIRRSENRWAFQESVTPIGLPSWAKKAQS
jgi:hypothetical protein